MLYAKFCTRLCILILLSLCELTCCLLYRKKPLSTTISQLQPQPSNPNHPSSQRSTAPTNPQLHPSLPTRSSNSHPQFNSATLAGNTQFPPSYYNRTTQRIGSQQPSTQQALTGYTQNPSASAFDDENDDFFMDIDEAALLASTASDTQTRPPTQIQSTSRPCESQSNSTKPVVRVPPLKRKPPTNSTSTASEASVSTGNLKKSEVSAKGRKTKVLGLLKRQQPIATPPRKPNSGFNSSDDELFLLDESNLARESPEAPVPNSPELITLDDDDEEPHSHRVAQPPSKPASTRCKVMPAAPYQYIKQIINGQIKVGQTVSIKSIVSTLTSNIQVDKTSGEWKLSVNINDGSGFLIARIAPAVSQFVSLIRPSLTRHPASKVDAFCCLITTISQVLDGIIGFSPSQMKQIKASKSSGERAKVGAGMKLLTKTLVHFSGIMRIKISAEERLIIEMMGITTDDAHSLATRTFQFAS